MQETWNTETESTSLEEKQACDPPAGTPAQAQQSLSAGQPVLLKSLRGDTASIGLFCWKSLRYEAASEDALAKRSIP